MAARAALRYGGSLLAALAAVAAVTALFAHPYVTALARLPLGYDAPFYVWRVEAAIHRGLEGVGAVRAGTPLLHAVLVAVTGRTPMELAAWMPALLAGLGGLAAAALARVSLGLGAAWIPVVGFLSWAAFGHNAMVVVHLDNVLNVVLLLAAFAAAAARLAGGRGAAAAAMLLAAAGIAHWSFLAFGLAVYVPAVLAATWMWPKVSSGAATGGTAALLGAAAAPAAFVAATLAFPAPGGWSGPRLGQPFLRELLERRFRARLRDPNRMYALPLALAGAAAALAARVPDAKSPARRFFVALMASWAVLTVIAGIAQLFGLPTAGARLLHVFFPATILAGVAVAWAGTAAARRLGARGIAVGVLLAAAAVAGFGTLAWRLHAERSNVFMDHVVLERAAAAAVYLERVDAERTVAWLLDPEAATSTLNRRWSLIRAAIPGDLAARSEPYAGSVPAFRRSEPAARDVPLAEDIAERRPVGVVVDRLYPSAFERHAARPPGRVVAPGVLVLEPPAPGRAAPAPEVGLPTRGWDIAARLLPVLGLLWLVGLGWSLALLPPDPVLRVSLAPALGAASIVLSGLGWAALGLPLRGGAGGGPALIAALAGLAAAVAARSRTSGADPATGADQAAGAD